MGVGVLAPHQAVQWSVACHLEQLHVWIPGEWGYKELWYMVCGNWGSEAMPPTPLDSSLQHIIIDNALCLKWKEEQVAKLHRGRDQGEIASRLALPCFLPRFGI